MAEEYFPSSDFLISVANEEAPIDGTVFGQANLKILIAMTRDSDVSNRDWATMLLSQHGPMTDEVRDALLVAAEDEDLIVRAEAIDGLVRRDREKALALVKRELSGEFVPVPLLYAAIQLADPSVAPLLEPFTAPSDEKYIDDLVIDALKACQK